MTADPRFIAGTVAAAERQAVEAFRPAVSSRECELMAEAGRLRELLRDTNALAEKQARMIGQQREELRTLKGENATPQRGCQFFSACLSEATVLCEYEYSAAEAPIYDADHPGVGPGHDAELNLIQVFINGMWCDPTDFMSEAAIERIEQQILEGIDTDPVQRTRDALPEFDAFCAATERRDGVR